MVVSTLNRSRSVGYLRDLQDFGATKASFPDTGLFLTSSLAVYQRLKDEAQEVLGVWNYLDDDDRKQVVLEATRLKDQWYQDFKGSLEYRGVNMGEALKFSVYYFLFEALSANRIAEKFFVDPPSRIRLPAIAEVPVRYSLHTQSSVPEAVFAFHAGKASVPVDWIDIGNEGVKSGLAGVQRYIPEPLLRLRRRLKNKWSAKQSSSHAREFSSLKAAQIEVANKQSRFTAICASCFQNFLMLLPIAAALENTPDWSALRLHTVASLDYDAAFTDPSSIDFVSDGRDSFSYLELYRIASEMPNSGKNFISRLWQDFTTWQNNFSGSYPAVFANSNLAFQYEYLLKRLMQEACMLVDAALEIFEKIPPDIVLVGNGSEKDHALAAVASSRNIPTVLVPHNRVWAYPEVYDFPVDYLAVRNEGTAKFLEDVLGSRRSIVVGDLKPQKQKSKKTFTHTERSTDLKNEKRILIVTGWVSPGLFQFFNIGASYDALDDLLSQAAQRLDWKLVFRYHPRSAALDTVDDLVRRVANHRPGQITIEVERSAEELIPESDVLVLFDYRSSPVIAAWKQGVPVVYWRSSQAFYSSNDMLKEEAFLTVRSFAEFEATIDRLGSDADWRKMWLENGHRLAEEYFSDPDLPQTFLPKLLETIILKKQ